MTTVTSTMTGTRPRRTFRSVMAIVGGFMAVAALSLATDQLLHVLRIYPPWGEPMYQPGLNILAFSYRTVYTILGGYITAALAPHSPMRHVVICGIIGSVVATAGAIAAVAMADLGPDWYPIALAVTGLPCVWLGGVLHRQRQAGRG